MKKIRQIDYACLKGERIWFPNMRGERFEGVIIKWEKIDDVDVATVRMDDGTEKQIKC